MDVTTLRQMIHGGETYTVEFKKAKRRNDLSDDDIIEAAMCLANGQGGTFH
jgi:ATP-dependent DNA helicase RecG